MRHRKRNVKFGRHPAHRNATVLSLVANLIRYRRIETTLAKAKEARRLADRIVTWAKRGGLHHRRLAYSMLGDRDLVAMAFNDIAPLFANRQGGYTRVIHTRTRPGDGAQLAILEWTEVKPFEEKPKAKAEEKPKVRAAELPKPEEKPKIRPKEKPKTEEKPKPRPEEKPKPVKEPAKTDEKKKGFLGGLRNLFQKKKEG